MDDRRKRVLFVDDDQRLLESLERVLRRYRNRWEMCFSGSGEEAIRSMEEGAYDVVVTDLRMTGMKGDELLQILKERFPNTVRIVLSGYSNLEMTMRSVGVSHQYLCKPCDPELLYAVVHRACHLEDVLGEPAVRKVVSGLGTLPSLPNTIRRVNQAMADPEVAIPDLARIIEQDPGIAANILHVVNSSYFGPYQEIASIGQAISHLGLDTLRGLVLGFEISRTFGNLQIAGFSLEEESTRSVLTARLAAKLCDEPGAREAAFTAALLHDAGKLVLAACMPERITAITRECGLDRPFHQVERELYDTGHEEIGAYLLGLWGLPYSMVEAVAFHHRPSAVPMTGGMGILGVVHLASTLVEDGPDALDLEFIERANLARMIPVWEETAREVVESN